MKQVRELHSELIAMACEQAGHKQDHRFNSWAKIIEAVDPQQKTGYAFVGPFINEGTTEIEVRPTAFLVMTSSGSRKYQTRHYNVIVMDTDGNLTTTDIETTDKTRGWALRIRDQVTTLLNELSGKDTTQVPAMEAYDQMIEAALGVSAMVMPLTDLPSPQILEIAGAEIQEACRALRKAEKALGKVLNAIHEAVNPEEQKR